MIYLLGQSTLYDKLNPLPIYDVGRHQPEHPPSSFPFSFCSIQLMQNKASSSYTGSVPGILPDIKNKQGICQSCCSCLLARTHHLSDQGTKNPQPSFFSVPLVYTWSTHAASTLFVSTRSDISHTDTTFSSRSLFSWK